MLRPRSIPFFFFCWTEWTRVSVLTEWHRTETSPFLCPLLYIPHDSSTCISNESAYITTYLCCLTVKKELTMCAHIPSHLMSQSGSLSERLGIAHPRYSQCQCFHWLEEFQTRNVTLAGPVLWTWWKLNIHDRFSNLSLAHLLQLAHRLRFNERQVFGYLVLPNPTPKPCMKDSMSHTIHYLCSLSLPPLAWEA